MKQNSLPSKGLVVGIILLIVLAVGVLLPAHQALRLPGRDASARHAAIASTGATPADAPLSESSLALDDANKRYQTAFQIETPAGQPANDLRRIIYEAQISLVVDNLGEVESALLKLLADSDGYVADSNVNGRQGDQLTATWRVRVPVTGFESFLAAVGKLGVTENRQQTAQDVSEEFVDIEARLATQKELERRIVELLASADDKIEDILEVERELARVRGEIEQMEGRLRYLTDRVDLTTVTISVREQRDYVPPEAPTFVTRVGQSWDGSIDALRQFGEELGLAIVASVPWVGMASVVAAPVGLVFASRRRAARRASTNTPSA
jgi:uncharacterized coiled-coil protein SlyX